MNEHYILLNLYTPHIPDFNKLSNYLTEALRIVNAVELTTIDTGQYVDGITTGIKKLADKDIDVSELVNAVDEAAKSAFDGYQLALVKNEEDID